MREERMVFWSKNATDSVVKWNSKSAIDAIR